MQVKLSEVVNGIEATDIEHQLYYYIPEQRILFDVDDDEIEDLRDDLIALPSYREKDDYGIMVRFIEEETYSDAKEWLSEAIRGAGAFRRFRSTLERFNLLDKWYDYRYGAYEDLAIEWCNYYGIEYIDEKPFEIKKEEEVVKPVKKKNEYRLINISEDNIYGLVYLVKDFRKALASFKNLKSNVDVDEALEEFKYYIDKKYPIYAISEAGKYIGYCVCKIIDDVVWIESIFVLKEYRRKGVGELLLKKAEELSEEYGNDTLYFNVHPNNHEMLDFLKANGYDVLNLIEIRKPYKDEEVKESYSIDNHIYKY